MAGKLIISLDFELMWGVRDHRSIADYGDAIIGGRRAIPEMLRRFEAFGIRATWATVGLLFAKNREEMLAYAPELRPLYGEKRLSPYGAIEKEIGDNENMDPFYFGRSLLEQIRDCEGQEIGTHTFSHYYCLEEEQSGEAFEADLKAALMIARDAGFDISSIVFPRNQMSQKYIRICEKNHIRLYRGNQGGLAYRSRPGKDNSQIVRGLRLLDSVMPVTGRNSYEKFQNYGKSVSVQASRFLRPYTPRLKYYNHLHISQVIREMQMAARRDEIYHLWWHPHNMGRHTENNLARLDKILNEYKVLNNEYGMTSENMNDALSDVALC